MISKKPLLIISILTLFVFSKCTNTNPKEENSSDSLVELTKKTEPIDKNRIIGSWLRSDGNYKIEIKSLNDNGKLDASYYNPNPIHIENAEWKLTENRMIVFIKLQDVNYPGSTYTLEYFLADDIFSGNYFQAVEGMNYNVDFARVSN